MNDMKVLLAKVGWSQSEFARRIGGTPTTVSSWCRGEVDSVAYRLAMSYLQLLVTVVK